MDTEPAKRSLRYAVATVCFILVAVAGGWLLWRIYDDLVSSQYLGVTCNSNEVLLSV